MFLHCSLPFIFWVFSPNMLTQYPATLPDRLTENEREKERERERERESREYHVTVNKNKNQNGRCRLRNFSLPLFCVDIRYGEKAAFKFPW